MKVNVGQLKNNLSKYLRELDTYPEPLEVCVREQTVAYLTSARSDRHATIHSEANRIESTGLSLSPAQAEVTATRLDLPTRAGDGKCDIDSIASLRNSRDW